MAEQPATSGVIMSLSAEAVEQAWQDGEEIQREDRKWSRHGDTRTDALTLNWYSARGRIAELAVERWLGLPLLPRFRYGEDHFDTHAPWAVQVKSVGQPSQGLYIGLSGKNHCWTCPYILAWVPDPAAVMLIGWATGPEVKRHGYRVKWGGGGESICLPQKYLRPMPGPTTLHARMFHRGAHSICPHGRPARRPSDRAA